jgi:hypothetical protein
MTWIAAALAVLLAIVIVLAGCSRPKRVLTLVSLKGDPMGIKLAPQPLVMQVGATHLLDLQGFDQFGAPFPIPASPAPSYSSDTPASVTIGPDPAGNPAKVLITAVAPGSANIFGIDPAAANPQTPAFPVQVAAPVLTTLQLVAE